MTATLVTPNPTYVTYAQQISKLRATLGGGNETTLTALPPYAIPFVPTAYMPASTIVAADTTNSIAFARTTDQVLHIVYLENYEWTLGALLTGGVDVWLNTPKRPYEASGTSGMKAALNGVPSLSILDGWWIEGWIEGVTGWAIEDHEDEAAEANSLYDQLEHVLLPLFYEQPQQWRRIMRSTIALNGSFFNTQRMLEQYVVNAYFPEQRITELTEEPEPALAR